MAGALDVIEAHLGDDDFNRPERHARPRQRTQLVSFDIELDQRTLVARQEAGKELVERRGRNGNEVVLAAVDARPRRRWIRRRSSSLPSRQAVSTPQREDGREGLFVQGP